MPAARAAQTSDSSPTSPRTTKTRADRQCPRLEVAAVDDGDDQAGDEPGLADDEQAGAHSSRDDPDQRALRRVPAAAPAGDPSVSSDAGASGRVRRSTGMWCTEIRLRNTQ